MNAHQKRTSYLIPIILLFALAPWSANAADMYVYFGSHRPARYRVFARAFRYRHWRADKAGILHEAVHLAFFVIHPDGRHLYTCNSSRQRFGQRV